MALLVGADAVNRLIRENSNLFSDGHCKVCSAVLISESQKLAHYQSKKHASKYRYYLMIHKGEDYTPAKRMRAETSVSASDETDRNKCCSVCNMTFTSPVVAASHYEGKIHAKNLRMMVQGGVKEGAPLSKKPRLTAPTSEKTSGSIDRLNPEKFCKLCSATFNNPHMAQQHYAGRKHKKHETKSKLMTIYSSSGTRMPQTTPLKPLTPGSSSTGSGFTCDICNIVVNSIEQYQAHITGSKHKNKSPVLSLLTENEDKSPQYVHRQEKETGDRKNVLSILRSLVPAPLDRASSLQPPGPSPSRGPPSRFSFSASGFSSPGFYSSPISNVTPTPPMTAPLSRGPPSERSNFNQGLLLRPPYISQNYGAYPHKNMSGSDGYNYFNQKF